MPACPYARSRGGGELWNVGGDPWIAMPPFPGEARVANWGNDLVQSLVYCVVFVLVAPMADRSGEVVAL
jgi:hypothetical protein